MIRLLRWLLIGHVHEWETVTISRLEVAPDGVGKRYVLRCKKCGDVKKRDLI